MTLPMQTEKFSIPATNKPLPGTGMSREWPTKANDVEPNGSKSGWRDLVSRTEFYAQRLATFLHMSFVDDPAWLAFMFY